MTTDSLDQRLHLFCHQDQWFAIHAPGMATCAVEEDLAVQLRSGLLQEGDAALEALGFDSSVSMPFRRNAENVPVTSISLFLTQSCNLRCTYCYGEGGTYGTGGELDVNTAFQAVDWLLEQSGNKKRVNICFFGGEPFLRFPLMKAIVAYADERVLEASKTIEYSVVTNGTLLDDEKIAFIKEHDLSVSVSFDGLKQLHDAQRPFADGRGSYDLVALNCKRLLAEVPAVGGHAVIVGHADPEAVKSAILDFGFRGASVTIASRPSLPGEAVEPLHRDTPEFLSGLEQETGRWIELARARNKDELQVLIRRSCLYSAVVALANNRKRRFYCGAGLGFVAVSCVGDVYLCHRIVGNEQYKLGSVFHNQLNRADHFSETVDTNAVCRDCFARYFCGGGCKHDNLGTCGSINAPAMDSCRIKQKALELAAVVVSNLNEEDLLFLVREDLLPPKPCPFDF